MRTKVFVFLFCFLLVAFAGCRKHSATQSSSGPQATVSPTNQESGPAKFDVCGLIKKEEIEATQGSPITDTKGSGRSNGELRTSQCFYTATEFSKSINLAVTQSDPDSAAKRSPKDFWKETFGRYSNEEKEREGDKEKKESLREQGEKERSVPPKKVDGIGDDAYWVGNRVGGALYVLKKDTFIRISVGGTDNEETKINKLKALAQKALDRL
jgi:hypothetical protein